MQRISRIDLFWILFAAGMMAIAVTLLTQKFNALPALEASRGASVKLAVAELDSYHYRAARRILSPLAHAGNVQAETWLGYLDANGLGTSPNATEGVAWYEKAAGSGDVLADRRLGQLYLNGTGVLQNVEQAREWLQRAAVGGDPVSQRLLGELYAKGLGVPKDATRAYAWLDLAASRGDNLAARERDALLPSLSPSELSQAAYLAQNGSQTSNVKPPGEASQTKLAANIAAAR